MKAMKRSVLFGTLTAIVVLIGLIVVGPQRIALADDSTGDEELAQSFVTIRVEPRTRSPHLRYKTAR